MRSTYCRWLRLAVAIAAIALLSGFPAARADDMSLWQEGCAKVEAGDLAGAADCFNQLVDQYPTSPKAPPAQLKLAYIKIRTSPDSTEEILGAFSLVRSKYPSSAESAEALARIGFLHSKADAPQAITDFTDFLTSYPGHPLTGPVQQSLGRLYLRGSELDGAETAFDQAKAAAGVSASLRDEAALQSGFVKIMKFYASKEKAHLDAAVQSLAELASSGRVNVRARADLGIAEATLLLGKPMEAREKYGAAAQTYAGQPYFSGLALYGAAVCSQQARETDTATADYAAFLAAQPGSTLAEKDAAWRSAALASTSLRAQISIQQDGAWHRIPAIGIVARAAYLRGECLYILGRYEEAKQQFQEVLSAFPEGEIAGQAQAALLRAEMAKGGS